MELGKDFERDVNINKYKLDDECERHPNLFLFYSGILDDYKYKKDDLEEKYSFLSARKELALRKDPPKGVKITNDYIAAELIIDSELKTIRNSIIEIKNKINEFSTAVKTIEHRKSMLDNLVKLYGQGYFALPEGRAKRTKTDDVSDNLRTDLNRRRNNNE